MPTQRQAAKILKYPVGLILAGLLSATTLCCGGSGNGGTQWVGTFSQPDASGAGYGAISFIVEPNNTVFCIRFSGPAAVDQYQFDTPCKNPATDSYPITDNQFSTPGGGYTIEGQFTSPTQASGYISYPSSEGEIIPYLGWSATKKGS